MNQSIVATDHTCSKFKGASLIWLARYYLKRGSRLYMLSYTYMILQKPLIIVCSTKPIEVWTVKSWQNYRTCYIVYILLSSFTNRHTRLHRSCQTINSAE